HHGLLNMLVGTARSISGAGVHEALRCTDAAALAAEAGALSRENARIVRDVFACYGSMSLTGPVADLIRLGLLPNPTPRRVSRG
ncbi:MAG: hypothetical protein ACRDUV_24590, partial [Pseudonocardiaceae bacterium]